jgi:hypothetical protein
MASLAPSGGTDMLFGVRAASGCDCQSSHERVVSRREQSSMAVNPSRNDLSCPGGMQLITLDFGSSALNTNTTCL